MTDVDDFEKLTTYDFTDKLEWNEDRLRRTAASLFRFLQQHRSSETVPRSVLSDIHHALGNIAFEMKMRKNEQK